MTAEELLFFAGRRQVGPALLWRWMCWTTTAMDWPGRRPASVM
ncbi:hypothetical protein [Streptomyces sp. NPDC047829]